MRRRTGYEYLLTLLKIEGKLVWKGIDILIFGICFPIILGTLFGYLLSKEATTGASSFELSYAAVITIGVLATGVMGVPLTIADYRHRGILKRFKVTDVSPFQIKLMNMPHSFDERATCSYSYFLLLLRRWLIYVGEVKNRASLSPFLTSTNLKRSHTRSISFENSRPIAFNSFLKNFS